MRKLLLGVFTLCILCFSANAQTADHKLAIGLKAGISEYSGDLGNGFLKFDMLSHRIYSTNGITTSDSRQGFIGLNFAYYLSNQFDLSASINKGQETYFRDINNYYHAKFNYSDITVRWKLLGNDNARFSPYILAGIGSKYTSYASNNDYQKSGVKDLVVPLGLGLNIKCEKRFYVNIQSNYGWTNGDKVEGKFAYTRFSFDQFWHHSIGFNILIDTY